MSDSFLNLLAVFLKLFENASNGSNKIFLSFIDDVIQFTRQMIRSLYFYFDT